MASVPSGRGVERETPPSNYRSRKLTRGRTRRRDVRRVGCPRLSLAGTGCLHLAPKKYVFADRTQCRCLSLPVLKSPQKSAFLPTEPIATGCHRLSPWPPPTA